MSPQELLIKRNEVAAEVAEVLSKLGYKIAPNTDNIYEPVAKVDLGDGFSVEIIVSPQMAV